jgi:hypothetical protein
MKNFIKSLNPKELKFFVIYVGWSVLHFFLLIVGYYFQANEKYTIIFRKMKPYHQRVEEFFPYEDEIACYDITEFLVYVGLPLGIFLLYRYLQKVRNED